MVRMTGPAIFTNGSCFVWLCHRKVVINALKQMVLPCGSTSIYSMMMIGKLPPFCSSNSFPYAICIRSTTLTTTTTASTSTLLMIIMTAGWIHYHPCAVLAVDDDDDDDDDSSSGASCFTTRPGRSGSGWDQGLYHLPPHCLPVSDSLQNKVRWHK